MDLKAECQNTKSVEFSFDLNRLSLVVLCGCKTWSLTLREEYRLTVPENSVLRKIFGPKTNEVREKLRTLPHEELRDM
jgi:hypothetical protein